MANIQNNTPYIFLKAHSTVLPDPNFSLNLQSKPTNSFFQNLVLKYGDQPEYMHPYLIGSFNSSLSISYPSHHATSSVIYQPYKYDITISSKQGSKGRQWISSYNDLSVTLDISSSNIRFFLVRGNPFVTMYVNQPTLLSITTMHNIISFSPNNSHTKFIIWFNNGQTWFLYASSPIMLSCTLTNTLLMHVVPFNEFTSNPFIGTIRIVLLHNSKHGTILDKYSSYYPISGEVVFREPLCVEWQKNGLGNLLLLAHPFHLKLLSNRDSDAFVLGDFKYKSIDGDLAEIFSPYIQKNYQNIQLPPLFTPIYMFTIHSIKKRLWVIYFMSVMLVKLLFFLRNVHYNF